MRFAFTPEQLELRDAVGSLLSASYRPAQLEADWTAPAGELDRSIWLELSDMGVFGVLVPEAIGGLGLDWCSLVLLLEECGRVGLPHPVVETAAVAAPLLGAAMTNGEMVSASLAGTPAACGQDADSIIVEVQDALWVVPVWAVEGRQVQSVDRARRLLALDDGLADDARLIAHGRAAVERASDQVALGTAAQLIGLSGAMLDLTVAYVSERQQFGVPVGSFQAVKHRLADALKELSFARPVVYRAAWSLSVSDPDAAIHVSTAKAIASDAACLVAEACLQCHGAIGYAYEYPLHRLMKRVWALSRSCGSAAWHRARVGRYLENLPAG